MPVHAQALNRTSLLNERKRGRGRPANAGAAQRRMILDDIGVYRALRAKKASQNDIAKATDNEARRLILHFGWENPLGAATAAETTSEGDGRPVLDGSEQSRRDALFKKVRNEVLKIWRENLSPAAEATGQSSAEIAQLIKIFARKPRRKQLYKVWAKLKARPDLEAEVDMCHAARVQADKPDTAPPRIATWNVVAAEWYKSASKKEKKAARKQSKRMHRIDMKEWEANASTMPQSPEEAIKFMRLSQLFLSDLMHFFANRASGIAVMFLNGPSGSSVISEGVCNVLEQPKLLYSEVNPDGCAQFKYALAKQAQILNETKWGEASIITNQHVSIDKGNIEYIESGSHEGRNNDHGNVPYEIDEGGKDGGEKTFTSEKSSDDGSSGEDYSDDADDCREDISEVEFLSPMLISGTDPMCAEHSTTPFLSSIDNSSARVDARVDQTSLTPELNVIAVTPAGTVHITARNASPTNTFAFDVTERYIQSSMDAVRFPMNKLRI
ncbi:unnamed protein product [Peniophora sp. CBMAI 1063]|nr:unnamed protein product [Peniophora sp. CBMAI 1063]